jgi:hypothetical protein
MFVIQTRNQRPKAALLPLQWRTRPERSRMGSLYFTLPLSVFH